MEVVEKLNVPGNFVNIAANIWIQYSQENLAMVAFKRLYHAISYVKPSTSEDRRQRNFHTCVE